MFPMESRVLMRFNSLRDLVQPVTVYRCDSDVVSYSYDSHRSWSLIWASPTGICAYIDKHGNLQELAVLRPELIPSKVMGPASIWIGKSPDLKLVTLEYGDKDYEWIFEPCLEAVYWVRDRMRIRSNTPAFCS